MNQTPRIQRATFDFQKRVINCDGTYPSKHRDLQRLMYLVNTCLHATIGIKGVKIECM